MKVEREWILEQKVFASNSRPLSEIRLSLDKNRQESPFTPWKGLQTCDSDT